MKDIPGYEKQYAIDENGNIWSYKTNKLLKQKISNKGYLYVCVTVNKKCKTLYVHRALALTYIENPENYPTVDHIDRNKLNNNLSNLRWASYEIQNNNKNNRINNKEKTTKEKDKERYWKDPEKSRAKAREKAKKRYWKDPEKSRAKAKERYWKDPEKARAEDREKYYKRKTK